MSIPAAPYRCPPGPYMSGPAWWPTISNATIRGQVIVLDANPKIVAEAVNFGNAFNLTYAGIVDYRPGVSILSIDAAAGTVNTSAGPVKGDVINAIPPQRAGGIIATAGLNNVGGRWAGSTSSATNRPPPGAIHVIGDVAATTQPKAGHIANQGGQGLRRRHTSWIQGCPGCRPGGPTRRASRRSPQPPPPG